MRYIWMLCLCLSFFGAAVAQPSNDPFLTNGRLMRNAIQSEDVFKVAALLKIPYVDPSGYVENNRRISFLPLVYSKSSLQSQKIFKMLIYAGANEVNCDLLLSYGKAGTPESNTSLLLKNNLIHFGQCGGFWIMQQEVTFKAAKMALDYGYEIREDDAISSRAPFRPAGSEITYSMLLEHLDKVDISSDQVDKAIMILEAVGPEGRSEMLNKKSTSVGFRLIDLLVYSSCESGMYQTLKRPGWHCYRSQQSPNMLRLLNYLKQNGSPPARTDCYEYVPYKTYPPICWFFN